MYIPDFGKAKPFHFKLIHKGQECNCRMSEVTGKRYWWWVHSDDLCGVVKWERGELHFEDTGSGWGIHLEKFREVLISWYG